MNINQDNNTGNFMNINNNNSNNIINNNKVSKDDYKFSNAEFDFSKFINHKRGIYNDIVGISVQIILDDDDEEVLKNHGYRKTINAYFDYYFYKDRDFIARLVVPDNVFPPSYKDDYEKMFKYFHDTLSIQMMKPDDDRYLYGEKDLNDK